LKTKGLNVSRTLQLSLDSSWLWPRKPTWTACFIAVLLPASNIYLHLDVCKFGIGQLEIFKKILAWIITSNCECICYEKNVWVTLQEWIYCELLGCIYCIISYSELLIMFLCNKFVCGFLDWVKYVIMLLSMVSYSNSCVFTMYKVISIECLLCTQWVRLLECVYYEISYCDLLVCVL